MVRQQQAQGKVKRFIVGGLAALMLGGAVLAGPIAPVAASEAPVVAQEQQFTVGFYVTGGKIVDLHQLIGEPFEQVVQRNTGAQLQFGYDGSFRFQPADDSPVMMGWWEVKEKQENIELEASYVGAIEGGRYETAMRGRIDLNTGLARIEQARQVIENGNAVVSYTEFSMTLY
jgi:hypothetical protein